MNKEIIKRGYEYVLEKEQDSKYKVGDICTYSYDNDNKSLSIVKIVRILNDSRGIAEVQFLDVIIDDSGNDYFTYLLQTGKTMKVSFKYLKLLRKTVRK